MMIIPTKVVLVQLASSKQPSSLSTYMSKRVGERGQPCVTLILQIISSNQPLVFLNLAMTFSYNLITTTLNLKRTFVKLLNNLHRESSCKERNNNCKLGTKKNEERMNNFYYTVNE